MPTAVIVVTPPPQFQRKFSLHFRRVGSTDTDRVPPGVAALAAADDATWLREMVKAAAKCRKGRKGEGTGSLNALRAEAVLTVECHVVREVKGRS